ncbi:MAG: PEGA domain-containing protein [Thermoguttaceae bacterium]
MLSLVCTFWFLRSTSRLAMWVKVSALVVLVVAATSGCVRRRMTIHTNPVGATVYRDNVELGKTPVSVDFQNYGKQEFMAVKEGYETKKVVLPVRPPWYQWFGIDFVTEVLLPGTLTDHQEFQIDMQPQRMVPPTELLSRAEEVRVAAGAGTTVSRTTNGTPIQPVSNNNPAAMPVIPIAQPLSPPPPSMP